MPVGAKDFFAPTNVLMASMRAKARCFCYPTEIQYTLFECSGFVLLQVPHIKDILC
jgi:hypothetical protein